MRKGVAGTVGSVVLWYHAKGQTAPADTGTTSLKEHIMNLLSRCDAEASGASAAVVTYERVTGQLSESVTLCQHHDDVHGPALKFAGFSPFQPTAGEQQTISADRFADVDA